MVGVRADDAAEQLLVVEECEGVLEIFAGQPDQLTFIPVAMIGFGRIAGVHSMVWIFAIRAELISFALRKSCSSFQRGSWCASRSQT